MRWKRAILPGVGFVCRGVVGEDPLDADTTLGESGDGAVRDTDCRCGLLARAGLGVSDVGAVTGETMSIFAATCGDQ